MTDERLRPPDFINIGAQKAASTWLYNCLREHPQILMGPKNRVKYFQYPDYAESRWNWYLSHFSKARPGQTIGDSRVEYLYHAESPGLIAKHLPRCKLLVILRDPVERALSAYLWMQRRRLLPLEPPDSGLAKALASLDRRQHNELEARLRQILDMGLYHQQLGRYLEVFDRSRLLILLAEDARCRPLETMQSVFRFLGVDWRFTPASLDTRPTRAIGNPLLIWADRASVNVPGAFRTLQALNRVLEKVGVGRSRPGLSSTLRQRLQDHYMPHNEQLSALLRASQASNESMCKHLRLEEVPWLSTGVSP